MALTICTSPFINYQSLNLGGENSDLILHIGRNLTPTDSVFRLSVQYLNQSASLTDETQAGSARGDGSRLLQKKEMSRGGKQQQPLKRFAWMQVEATFFF